jgi:hypothetical protein
MIAECLYSQVDEEGRQYVLLDDFIDYEVTEDCMAEEEKFQISPRGTYTPDEQPKVGNSVYYGKTALRHGSHSRT